MKLIGRVGLGGADGEWASFPPKFVQFFVRRDDGWAVGDVSVFVGCYLCEG